MSKIKITVAGCGGIFNGYRNAYLRQSEKGFDDFEIVAFCDPVKERTVKFADKRNEVKGVKPAVVL